MAIPVSLDDAKLHLRHAGENLTPERQAEIEGFIADAAGWVEGYTGHILEARDVTEQFSGYGAAKLRAWPIAPTAVPGVAYAHVDGTTIATVYAHLDVSSRPALVSPPNGHFYTFRGPQPTFTVTVRAGYEPVDAVPSELRRAMLVLIAAYDVDREGGEVFAQAEATAKRLCRRLKLSRL